LNLNIHAEYLTMMDCGCTWQNTTDKGQWLVAFSMNVLRKLK